MGHQVNYYLLPEDMFAVERELAHLDEFHVLCYRSPTPRPRIVDTTPLVEDGKPVLGLYLVRRDDLAGVVTRHVPTQGYWVIDALLSPVVEFTGCFFDGQLLRRGRMYYVDGFFAEDGEWEEKAEPFRTWARAVLKRTKKILTRTESDYIGSHAAAWLAEGSGRMLVSM